MNGPVSSVSWVALVTSLSVLLSACGIGASSPPTPTVVSDQTLIRRVVMGSNGAFVSSMACACDSGLETYKTGRDLQKYLDKVQDLQVHNQHINVTTTSMMFHSITVGSSLTATADVTKHEIARTYTNGRLTATCSTPYDVEYFLQKVDGVWKVSDTNIIRGDPCAAGTPRPLPSETSTLSDG